MDVTLHLRYTVPLKGRGLACSLVHAACNRGGKGGHEEAARIMGRSTGWGWLSKDPDGPEDKKDGNWNSQQPENESFSHSGLPSRHSATRCVDKRRDQIWILS